jgi:hypothetical protein
VAIVNLLLTKFPHSKIDHYLIASYGLFLLGTLWKESMFTIALLLALIDFAFGWTKGRWHLRVLMHLPFYLIGAIGICLQMSMTNSLGYRMGWANVLSLLLNFPQYFVPVLQPLWGIWLSAWNSIFIFNLQLTAIVGTFLTVLFLLVLIVNVDLHFWRC